MRLNVAGEVARAERHFRELLGVLPEPIRAMAEYAPEALVAYLQFKDYIYKPKAQAGLDLKTKELIYVVLDTATGNLAGAKNHLRAAVDAGLNLTELAEAMIQIMNVCGITTWGQTGYKVMDDAKALIAERKKTTRTKPKVRKITQRKAR